VCVCVCVRDQSLAQKNISQDGTFPEHFRVPSAFDTRTKYRKSLSFMGVYVEKYVSPLKYPLKRDACNDRGRLQVLSRLADFIPYRLTHARAYHARVAFDYRVRAVYHVSPRRQSRQSASPVWFPVSRLLSFRPPRVTQFGRPSRGPETR